MKVQAFIAELAIEAFHEGVLDGLAWFNESETNTGSFRPIERRFARAFRAVVEDDLFRQARAQGQVVEEPCYSCPRNKHANRHINNPTRTEVVVIVDDVEHPKPAAVDQLIANKVHGPPLHGPLRHHVHARIVAILPGIAFADGIANTGLDRVFRIGQFLVEIPTEWRVLVRAVAESFFAGVAMGVDTD